LTHIHVFPFLFSSFILHPSSFILQVSGFRFHLSAFILHPSAFVSIAIFTCVNLAYKREVVKRKF